MALELKPFNKDHSLKLKYPAQQSVSLTPR